MAKRPIDNRELLFVVQESDVRKDGGMRKRARLHIARRGISSGSLYLACGIGSEPRYVYPYLSFLATFGTLTPMVCNHCRMKLKETIEVGTDESTAFAGESLEQIDEWYQQVCEG